jgi:hypothetical protein
VELKTMCVLDPTTPPSSTGGLTDEAATQLPVTAQSDPLPAQPSRVWTAALVAGIVAALVSWLAGEALFDAFLPKTKVVYGGGGPMTIATPAELAVTRTKNATLAFGALGAILGLTLGFAGGMARSSVRAGVRAALIGMVLGIVAAAAFSLVLLPVYNRVQDIYEEKASIDLTVPLLIHGGIWAAIGATAGLAFGIGLGGRYAIARGLLGGLVGAALGAVVYEIVGALAFPLDSTVQPLSQSWGSRLLARSAVALLVAVGVALAITEAGARLSRKKAV